MRILPAVSTSTSAAPERMKRLKPRVSACAKLSSVNFAATFFQLSVEYMKRQLSRPRVITTFFPKSLRKALGRETRFFSSRLWLYSPMNIRIKDFPLFPTDKEYIPLYPTARQLSTLRLAALAQRRHAPVTVDD